MKTIPGQIVTYSGKILDLMYPTVDRIDIDDIARGLANNSHFSGQMPKFFSLAEHSLMVEERITLQYPDDFQKRLVGLLHDAPEAFIGDMIKPLKVLLPDFCVIEDRLMAVIFEKFNLPIEKIKEIKPADIFVQEREYEAIQYKDPYKLSYLLPEKAYDLFLRQFNYLYHNYQKQS